MAVTTPPYSGAAAGTDTEDDEPVWSRSESRDEDSSASEPAAVAHTGGQGETSHDATSCAVYETVYGYFNKRLDMEGLDAADAQVEKMGKLLFSKRRVQFATDQFADTTAAVMLLEARRAYAEYCHCPMAMVTKETLVRSRHGLQGWIQWANPGATRDAPELVVTTVVSKDECIQRIHRVLSDRWRWLAANNLAHDLIMNNDQRKAFHAWALQEFAEEPEEQQRSEAQRALGKNGRQVHAALRSRFNLEKQRRAGTPQMWNLLSWLGRVTEEDVQIVLDESEQRSRDAEHPDIGRCDPAKKRRATGAKNRYRQAVSLQRRLDVGYPKRKLKKGQKSLLKRHKSGSLRRHANRCVLDVGRGRLHGEEGGFLDIGTNQHLDAVAAYVDGELPPPCIDGFSY